MGIRVLLCDAQPVVRAGMRTVLERDPDIEVVGEAGDGQQAVDTARTLRPTVVVTDIDLPGIDGIQATRQMAGPDATRPGVIIVTARDDDEQVAQAIRAGARGFLLKADPTDQLVYGVRVVAAGEALLTPSATRRLLEQFAGQPTVSPHAPPDPFTALTDRELKVLGLLARGRSNTEIAAMLSISEATVRSHTHHLLRKLGLRNRCQAVALAYQHGLVQPGQP